MPKPRSRNQETQKTSIDDFIHEPEKAVIDTADPNAPRKFKTVSLPLNEYEYNILVEACKKADVARRISSATRC